MYKKKLKAKRDSTVFSYYHINISINIIFRRIKKTITNKKEDTFYG